MNHVCKTAPTWCHPVRVPESRFSFERRFLFSGDAGNNPGASVGIGLSLELVVRLNIGRTSKMRSAAAKRKSRS
jgi:hypothetical protein